jgi:cold shock CspA family protein
MVEATVMWLSVTKEFGFVAPHDGSRDVFVPFYSGENSRGARSKHQDGSLLNDLDAPTAQRGAGVESHRLASIIEVRARYQVSRDSGSRVSQ